METESTILALAALAQSTRLEVFRLLIKHEPEGLAAGEIALGEVPVITPEPTGHFAIVLGYADQFRRLRVRTNADTPEDSARARSFGAEIRTEAPVDRVLVRDGKATGVVLAGSGVYWDDAAKSLAAFAHAAGAPVFMNGAGRGALPVGHPCAFSHARGWALARASTGSSSLARSTRHPGIP